MLECPTNQSDDQVREVEFPLRGAYETFTAVAVVSAVPDPAVRTQVDVFTVDEDGHALRPVNRVLTGNARAPLDTPVREAHALRLRVRCESSAAVITVLSPRVTA